MKVSKTPPCSEACTYTKKKFATIFVPFNSELQKTLKTISQEKYDMKSLQFYFVSLNYEAISSNSVSKVWLLYHCYPESKHVVSRKLFSRMEFKLE